MANGVVAFAGQLDIRGNYIVINHGWGVYTGYAHLSQINVERGQTLTAGQIIGASGNSGRSSGPHLHWEIAVNGEWIDGVLFLEMWLP
jgi:murein DD-endopeptidase MepM/ murein hydrolase activator NlpD